MYIRNERNQKSVYGLYKITKGNQIQFVQIPLHSSIEANDQADLTKANSVNTSNILSTSVFNM